MDSSRESANTDRNSECVNSVLVGFCNKSIFKRSIAAELPFFHVLSNGLVKILRDHALASGMTQLYRLDGNAFPAFRGFFSPGFGSSVLHLAGAVRTRLKDEVVEEKEEGGGGGG